MLAALTLLTEHPAALLTLGPARWAAVGHLAVMVTAVAFLLWYRTVAAVGAGRAGLLTGVAPLAAAAIGALSGGGIPGPPVWLGLVVVVAGLALGLRAPRRETARSGPPRALEGSRPCGSQSADADAPVQQPPVQQLDAVLLPHRQPPAARPGLPGRRGAAGPAAGGRSPGP
ncbi:EamA family transporter [Streptomyces vinaceus]